MPEDFIGELSKVRLLDLVRPMVNRKNSGMVLVRGTELGELYIEAGHIVHAKTGDALGDEAALAMIDWDKGRVIFDWESTTDERTVRLPTEQVLERWTERDQEWKRIREVIPSADVAFRIPIDGTGEDRHIPGDQWRILILSNGTRSVAEVAGLLGWDVFKVSKAICQMVEAGLLEKAGEATPSPRETVNGDFIPTIETELKKALGPVAQFIVDDKIAEFGESRSAFPRDRVQAFVKAIDEEISDDAKRDTFELGILEVSLLESTHKLKALSKSPANRLLSADEFWETIKPAGEVKTFSIGRTEPNIEISPDEDFKPDIAQQMRPHTRRWTALLGYFAVVLLVVGVGLTFIFIGRQANRTVPAESGSPATPKISAAPVPSEAPAPPPAPAPIPEETIVSPDAEPKPPALASRQAKISAAFTEQQSGEPGYPVYLGGSKTASGRQLRKGQRSVPSGPGVRPGQPAGQLKA